MKRKVAKAIKSADDYPTIRQLASMVNLPYPETRRIVESLEREGKVMVSRGRVFWTAADNPRLRRLLRESVKVR